MGVRSMKLLMGNEAVALGALKAGMGFYSGYPITPASEIMHFLAKVKDLSFVHCEDEIAAINMIIGASLAGRKTMTATSGPGFSLMQEGLGLGYMAEIPFVIVNTMRVGPSTGMPTLPSQGDVSFACHNSHGDTYPIIFYPNSVEECYKITIEAFNCAEEAKQPVILLMDAFLSHMYEPVDVESINVDIKNRDKKKLGEGLGHTTGLISENGDPKTKDPEAYKRWLKRVKEKRDNIVKNYNQYEYTKAGDKLIIAYGVTSRVVSDLKDYSIFRPIRLFPVLDELKEIAKEHSEIIVVEMNDGQYADILEKELKREIKRVPILGGDITLEDVRKGLD
jgi:2-oxoglutarate/2-oxoacid ferredoxin oxidoreductase subunit alpha